MKLTSTQPAEESPCNGSGEPGRSVHLEKQPSRSQDARLQGDLVLVGADHLDKTKGLSPQRPACYFEVGHNTDSRKTY